ncbi:MAG: hypothetical protein BWK79_13720 [Beggiatoa sp. IS2]|nr:MAG: hypothetical protein BWK79_13720 [Beggiatoa sp. IS2]
MLFKKIVGLTSGLVFAASFSHAVMAADAATADEVVKKVQEAAVKAKDIAAKGDKAIEEEFNKADWKWKDAYVFVYTCKDKKADKMVVHSKLAGKALKDEKDKSAGGGKPFFDDMCIAGEKKPKGGWISYEWEKDGKPAKKVTYALAVEGSSYQVAAGIYDDKAKVEDLDKLLK